MNAKKDTIVRTVVLALALLNQILTALGVSPLPVDDAQLGEVLSAVITMAAALWAWWKNNSFTKAAIAADEVLDVLRNNGTEGVTVSVTEDSDAAVG